MKTRYAMLAGSALIALLAAGSAPPAEAKTIKHHARAAHADANAAEIQALREQVQALSARLNAQEAAQQQTQAQLVQSQTAATEAQVAAETEVKTIPTQVKTAVAASMPKPKPSWADNTSVSGRMYYDLSNVTVKSDGKRVSPTGTGFDIKRFYVGVDHKFNDVFSANVTTDFQYSSAISATELYIKKAYLQAKVSDALIVRLGSADLPWVPFVEDLYGYRYVENTLIDRTKFGTSADWGVHASGKLVGGKVQYALAVIDGAGYKAPLRSKTMDVEGRLSVTPVDHLTLAVGGYTGKLGKDVQGGVAVYHTASRADAVAAYTTSKFRIGAEYFASEDWNNITTLASNKADGYSVFGSYNITEKIGLFGRYDKVKPTKTSNSATKDGYFNVGVSYEPAKIVDFALLYKRDQLDNGTLSTSNGVIGGLRKGTYGELGLFGQYRF